MEMSTIDFTKVSKQDDLKSAHFRVLGYRNGVRKMSKRLTYSQARKAAWADSSLTIYSERFLCPTI
jgi:hypothetical protein